MDPRGSKLLFYWKNNRGPAPKSRQPRKKCTCSARKTIRRMRETHIMQAIPAVRMLDQLRAGIGTGKMNVQTLMLYVLAEETIISEIATEAQVCAAIGGREIPSGNDVRIALRILAPSKNRE